jgi:hypothetical protein
MRPVRNEQMNMANGLHPDRLQELAEAADDKNQGRGLGNASLVIELAV